MIKKNRGNKSLGLNNIGYFVVKTEYLFYALEGFDHLHAVALE